MGYCCSGQSLVKIVSVGRKTPGYSPTLSDLAAQDGVRECAELGRPWDGPPPSPFQKDCCREPPSLFYLVPSTVATEELDRGGRRVASVPTQVSLSSSPASRPPLSQPPVPSRVIALRVSTFAQWYSSSKLCNLLSNCFFTCRMGIINLPHEVSWARSDGRGVGPWHRVWSKVTSDRSGGWRLDLPAPPPVCKSRFQLVKTE